MTLSPERLAEWRAQPERAAIRRWENRTYGAALRQLAHEYPGRFLEIIDAIREADPRPGAEDDQQRRGAEADRAA